MAPDLMGHDAGDRWSDFLPQTGILDSSPNGRIPETRADGEPAFDAFERQQYSAGYVFERRVSDSVRVRQDGSFDHVDVDYQDVLGTGLDPSDPSERTLTRATFTILGDTDVFALDGQVLAEVRTGALAHALLGGIDYQHSTFDSVDGLGEAPALDDLERFTVDSLFAAAQAWKSSGGGA